MLRTDLLFDRTVWAPALEKYSAATRLGVTVFGPDGRVVLADAARDTPLNRLFDEYHYIPKMLNACALECLGQTATRPPVVVTSANGLAVVGASLILDGTIVGAAVAGYALVDFTQSSAIAALARDAAIPFSRLWYVARQQQPVPERRLVLQGELLQVLGDTILRENLRTRQYEDVALRYEQAAAQLGTEAAAKDEFFAVLSHELRTPLTPILAWVQILRRAGDDPDQRQKAAESIERNTLLQIRMIDDLLDLNRAIRDKMTLDIAVHDLSDLMSSAIDSVKASADTKGIRLVWVRAPEFLPVAGDAGRLLQVFANVLSNAIKFSRPGDDVQVQLGQEAGLACVRIADSGDGIAPGFLPFVFDLFRQQEEGTRRRHAGLGIGLALVKRLVELHDGRITVASRGIGRGTDVTIHLPLTQRPALGPNYPGGETFDGRPFNGLTILIVEDIEDSLERPG